MTIDERDRYDRWLLTHKPGSAANRSAAKLRRAQEAGAARLLKRRPQKSNSDIGALDDQISELERRLEALSQAGDTTEGVFA